MSTIRSEKREKGREGPNQKNSNNVFNNNQKNSFKMNDHKDKTMFTLEPIQAVITQLAPGALNTEPSDWRNLVVQANILVPDTVENQAFPGALFVGEKQFKGFSTIEVKGVVEKIYEMQDCDILLTNRQLELKYLLKG